jgi:hypothetical protein
LPPARAVATLRLSSQVAKTRPAGSTPATSKRWLVVSDVIGRGFVKEAPPSLERAK